MASPLEGIFTGGQMTDLPLFTGGALDGTELFEVVAPGNAEFGVNYSITSGQLAFLIPIIIYQPKFLTAGANDPGDPLVVGPSVTRLLVNKTVGSATYLQLDLASTFRLPLLIKDLKGDSDVNPITVTFSDGETIDGLTEVVISNKFGYFWFNPLAAGNWYDAAY